MKLPLIRTVGALLIVAAAAGAQAAGETRRPYIVQLAAAPAATYAGGISGYAATQPTGGRRLNVQAGNVQAYVQYLDAQQSSVIATQVPAARVVHRYRLVLNGFSALLTDAEVRKLRAAPGVASVAADERMQRDTVSTPRFLGLTAPGGLWSQLGGVGAAGEDIIVGIIDGGIWPEDPSFSDKVGPDGKPVPSYMPGTVVYSAPPAKWKGTCQAGEGFVPARHCNNKLIGAQYFVNTYDAVLGPDLNWTDYRSPRDEDGHGSHTASTAAGNANASAVVNGLDRGPISGMAPRARVAAYKVCWRDPGNPDPGSCYNGDSIAAIDQAVADGVDVINFSISGSRNNLLDPVEVAFFNASAAGVFVAASAGNNGPAASTVAHNSPWITTVAASTHDRFFAGTVMLGNGASYTGAALGSAAGPAPIVLSEAVAAAGVPVSTAALCFPLTLDPAKVAGKIVVCDRGVNDRVEKSAVVEAAGGIGMVLVNVSPGTLNDDAHSVPTVHLPHTDRSAIRAYAATAGSTASLSAGFQAAGVVAPVMAGFSSRGPNLASASLLKPDITAPGVSILAGYAYKPATEAERDLIAAGTVNPPAAGEYLGGTSMSSPHIAGLAALLKAKYPTWSPAAIKSALMTSAQPVKLDNGSIDGNRFGYGAGHVNPNGAATPGLIFDAGPADYLRFLCGANLIGGSTCATFGAIPGTDLNLPSMSADVLGRVTFKRRVKNVGTSPATFTASAAVPGFDVVVTPASLTVGAGESGNVSVTMTRTTATPGAWVFGSVSWSDGTTTVTSPVSVRSSALIAPEIVFSTAAAGSKTFTVGTGFNGSMGSVAGGLKPATVLGGGVPTEPTGDGDDACRAGGRGTQLFVLPVPAGTLAARFALYDEETSGWAAGGVDDLDLLLYSPAGELLAFSAGGSSTEAVNLTSPSAGNYFVCVVGWSTFERRAKFKLNTWVVGPKDEGSRFKAVVPSTVYTGATASAAMSWAARPGRRYLGAVQFRQGGSEAPTGVTMLLVDAMDTLPAARTAPSLTKEARAARR